MTVSTMTIALLVAATPQMGKKPAAKPAAKVTLPAGVVARYNGVDITTEDIKKQVSSTLARRIVPELIQRIVIEREAKKAGVSVTAAEVAEKVKEEKAKVVAQMAQTAGRMMTFNEITREFGLTEAEVEQTVRLNLLARKACEKALLKEVPGLDGQLRIAHILLATVPLAPTPDAQPLTPEQQKKKDDDQKARLEQILADIRAGKLKFDDAAKQFSDDKGSGAQGGELPWAGKNSYVPEFERAEFALAKVGDISPLVKTQFGWHIIKLLEKGSEASPAVKAKFRQDQVTQRLSQPTAVQQWLGAQARNAKIEFNPSAKLFK